MLCGLMFAKRPGVDDSVRETVPLNPLRPVMVIVEKPLEFAWTTTCIGLALIVKSGGVGLVTVTPTWKEWDLPIEGLLPVTVTM
jgi:hypothetical protein